MTYSANYRADVQSVNGDDVSILLLEIAHEELAGPVRVCNNTEDVVSGGQNYVATAFQFSLPDDRDGQPPRATLTFGNVGRDLMQWIEQAGGGEGAALTVRQIRAGAPDVIEYEITVSLQSITATVSSITAELGYDALLDRPVMQLRYDPSVAPGIF